MAKKNPFIQQLRDLGVTDYERRLLRNLQKEYEQKNAYSEIERLNYSLMKERVKPVTLNYENAVRLLQYNMYGNIREVINAYQQGLAYVDQGTTSEYEDYIERLAEELQDVGITVATPSNLKKANLGNIEYWYSEYKKYEANGDSQGMSKAREHIEAEIGA